MKGNIMIHDKIGNATIFNDDAIVVLNKMIEKNVIVDMIATDPPYKVTSRGSAGNSGGMLQKDINKKGQVFDNNNIEIEVWLPLCYKILKETGHCYIMTNHKNLHHYLDVAEEVGLHFIKSLIWNKGNKIMGQYYMSQFEYILFFRKGAGVKINNCGTADILNVPNAKTKDENGQNIHDTEKPVELMKILIENSSKVGEKILDPFMGVGSTIIAAQELDRKSYGMEIDNTYYDRSKSRLEEILTKE
jgi:site-specific DNA-methyltransferase (adenine-specific)